MTYQTTSSTSASWTDFNDAETQQSFDLLPKGTIVKVRMTLKPGGFNDPAQNWTGGYATRNATSDTVYLNCEFVVLDGQYAKRKVWSKIGLHSPKSPEWAKMGRSFVKGILQSARGISEKDMSPQAITGRRIQYLAELDGIEFTARIDVEKDQRNGEDRNTIKIAITPDHKEYGSLSASAAPSSKSLPSWAQQ